MATYSSVILAETGIQAYWKLDETSTASAVADAAPTPDNGTFANTASVTVAVTPGGIDTNTPANTAISLARGANTAGGHVTVPDANKLDMTTAFTIECWVKLGSTLAAGAFHTLFSKLLTGATVQGNYSFYMTNTGGSASSTVNLEAEIRGGSLTTATSPVTFAFGTAAWHHVAAVFNGSTVQFYVDGAALGGTVAAAQTLTATTTAAVIGRYGTGTDYWNGGIDEVAIYNAALNATAISTHYTTGTTVDAGGAAPIPPILLMAPPSPGG